MEEDLFQMVLKQSKNAHTFQLITNSYISFLVRQVINEMTGGGADYCFECVGLASLVHEAYACCRKVSLLHICFIDMSLI